MQSRREVFTAEPELGFIGRDLARPECVLACASGRLFVSDSRVESILDDSVPETVAQLAAAYESDTLTRPMLSAAVGRRLQNVSSLAFGGPDLRTAYLGCLKGDSLATFRTPVAGLPPVHWHWS